MRILESFTADFFCRIRRMTCDECKSTSVDRPEKRRTIKNYAENLLNLTHGVKSACIFNQIKNFHIVQNPSTDIMHDLSEGVSVYLIEGILTFLVLVEEIISIEETNSAIKNFNYGTLESKNEPQPLQIESCSEDGATGLTTKIKCKQSAAEMLITVFRFDDRRQNSTKQ